MTAVLSVATFHVFFSIVSMSLFLYLLLSMHYFHFHKQILEAATVSSSIFPSLFSLITPLFRFFSLLHSLFWFRSCALGYYFYVCRFHFPSLFWFNFLFLCLTVHLHHRQTPISFLFSCHTFLRPTSFFSAFSRPFVFAIHRALSTSSQSMQRIFLVHIFPLFLHCLIF